MVRSFVGSYRASRSKEPVVVVPDIDQNGSVSIVSIPKDRSERIKMIDDWKESRKKKVGEISCADSVMSDVTFSMAPKPTVPKEISGSFVGKASTHDFILECENGERIYVPSSQGMVIKARCQHFRFLLETNKTNNIFWGGSDSGSVSFKPPEHRIVTMKKWSTRTARHIIELLSDRVSWIENDQNRFVELLRACDEVNVRLYLGSPINYHDILDRTGSLRFFQLCDEEKYRFQLAGMVKSYHWMALIQKGILLDLDPSLLMLSSEPSASTGEDSKEVQRRLSKCNGLYSEFGVYSKRSMINSLYTILGILCINDLKSNTEKSNGGNKSTTSENLGESIQIVFKTVSGGLSERDLNMLWRMTSSSFTLSTPDEERLLQVRETNTSGEHPPLGNIRISKIPSLDCSSSTTTATTAEKTVTTMRDTIDGESTDSDGNSQECPIYSTSSKLYATPSKLESKLGRASQSKCSASSRIKTETRTITGTSFVALKHMFHPVNRSRKKKSSNINRDPSLLPASLSITNPTPDTLGRFLNACASIPGKNSLETKTKIGYDILPPSSPSNCKNDILFFVSDTTLRVKEILNCMSDYSGLSDVGEANFRLEQLRHV